MFRAPDAVLMPSPPARYRLWSGVVALLFVSACADPGQRAAPPASDATATAPAAPAGSPDSATASAAAPAAPPDSTTATAAAAVIRRYYQAINARDLRTAYLLWSDSGRSSGQSLDRFAAGFAETGAVNVEVGEPEPIGAAAGSRYVEIPVSVRAVTVAGREQRFEGTYTLRRSVVDGATAEQRRWRIYSARIARTR